MFSNNKLDFVFAMGLWNDLEKITTLLEKPRNNNKGHSELEEPFYQKINGTRSEVKG